MLIHFVEQLKDAGADVSVTRLSSGDFDALLRIDIDGVPATFAVEIRSRSPYPNELDTFLAKHGHVQAVGTPLLFAPVISEGVGQRLVDQGWSWADSRGNLELRAPGIRLRSRTSGNKRVQPASSGLPHGRGALRIIRFLINDPDGVGSFGPTHLATIGDVSQPRASQVLAALASDGLVERVAEGWRANREALLDAFISHYRGPGGIEIPLYSLDPPSDTAARIVKNLEPSALQVAISADVGPDLIAPWRSPSVVVIYADDIATTNGLGLVTAKTRSDANVLLRVPDDTSVFPVHAMRAKWKGEGVPLADQTQMLWDLHDLGGDDRLEAAGRLRRWILRFP